MSNEPVSKEQIFNLAAEIQDADQQQQLLDDLCGHDVHLRAEIEDLLSQDAKLGDFLEPPNENRTGPNVDTVNLDPDDTLSGSTIGNYQIQEVIGRGGMGAVYLARQSQPIKRNVALKVIRAGLDSRNVLARFAAERQALALMNHPNIARIIDVGTTDGGQPWFAMELVQGPPITRYCDDNRLSIEDRLKLFVDVCSGVQHAHQKGIIHRDLKPSNILVAHFDGQPVPKVIDFGLAKALESTQQLTEESLHTQIGQIVGTLRYMSPEQATLDLVDIDTRTDIYSLGVVLYELLTGSTPLDDDTLSHKSVLEVLEMIRVEDPVKPSRRFSSSGDRAAEITKQRRTDSSSLNRILTGDLDWVVTKALEKDRSRRYETAAGLARDVQRYLAEEMVEARPPSTGYRVMKLVRRYKVQVIAASLVLVALLAGVFGTSIGLYRAEKSRIAEVKERKRAQKKTREAEEERNKAYAATERERDALIAVEAAKAETDKALVTARKNENSANRLREKTEQLLEAAEQSAYVGEIVSAQFALDNGGLLVPELYDARWDLRGWEHNYLTGRTTANSFALLNHSSRTTSIEINARGDRVAVGGADGKIKIWQLQKSSDSILLKTIDAHEKTVSSLAFTPDSGRLVSGGYDRLIRIWNVDSGEELLTLAGHENRIRSLSICNGGAKIVSGSGDQTVRVWDVDTGAELLKLEGHKGEVRSVASSADGRVLASASADGTIKLWNTTTGKLIRTIRGHEAAVASVDLDSQGKQLISGSWDKSVKLWDVADGTLIRAFSGHTNMVMAVAFMGDDLRLVSAGWDGTLRFWNLFSGEELESIDVGDAAVDLSANNATNLVAVAEWNSQTGVYAPDSQDPVFRGHQKALAGVAISPNDREVASVDSSGKVKIWDLATRQELQEFQMAATPVGFLAFSPDGKQVYTSDLRNVVSVWSREDGKLIKESPGLCVSPDGRFVAGHIDGHIRLFDLESLRQRWATPFELEFPQGAPRIAFSADGKKVALGQVVIPVLDVSTGKEIYRVNNFDACACIKFDPSGQRLLSVGEGTLMRVWNGQTGASLVSVPTSAVEIEFNPSGDRIFLGTSASGRGIIEVWNAESYVRLVRLRKHGATISGLDLTSDGKFLVSSSHDHDVRVWDGTKTLSLTTSHRHANVITGVASSWEAPRIVTAGWGGKVHVFDALKGRMILSFNEHGCPVIGVTISEDGKVVVSRGLDGHVLFWDASTGSIFDSLQLPDGTDDDATPRMGRLAISRDHKKLLCSHHDERVTLWDLGQSRDKPVLEKRIGRVTSLDLSGDGQLIAVADTDFNVQLIQVVDASTVVEFNEHTSLVMDLEFDEKPTHLASISINGRLVTWDLEKETIAHVYSCNNSQSAAKRIAEASLTTDVSSDLANYCIQFGSEGYEVVEVALGSLRFGKVEFESIIKEMAKNTAD